LPQSIFKPLRYRICFAIGWWSLAQFQVILEGRAGVPVRWALVDGAITSSLLAGAVLLIALCLQHYLPNRNRLGYLLSFCGMLTIVWLAATYGLLRLVPGTENSLLRFFNDAIWIRGAFGFLIMGCAALVSMLWYTLQDREQTEERRTEAGKLARDAELNNLRQQLQPHFLFNSLNSINTLIGSQPQEARQMVLQLSEFLRGTLKPDQRQWVPIEEELQHLDLYLSIEKVRFGHRLQTHINNQAAGSKLPVLLLQPVVENAIKFGLYDTTEVIMIEVSAKTENGLLVIEVRNPYDPETSTPLKGTGFGLASVQRRLYLLFARHDLLTTEPANNIFTTRIKIPQP
jgi:two-component system LytT family sensor kinase